jgi:hypothetical protein
MIHNSSTWNYGFTFKPRISVVGAKDIGDISNSSHFFTKVLN